MRDSPAEEVGKNNNRKLFFSKQSFLKYLSVIKSDPTAKLVISIFSILVVFGGVSVGTLLTQRPQDIREHAQTTNSYDCDGDGIYEDLLTDNENCGDCGFSCTETGQFCFQGACSAEAPPDPGGPIGCPTNLTYSDCDSVESQPATGTCNGVANCGTYRIECVINGQYCLLGVNCTQKKCEGGTPTPTPDTIICQCDNVQAYDPNWNLMSDRDLGDLVEGDNVHFCVNGSDNSDSGYFDKAKFTVNGYTFTETKSLRPGTSETFCQAYTVPGGVYNFIVTARLHHTILGWIK